MQTGGNLKCLRCRKDMTVIIDIPAVGSGTGMQTYQCPECGRWESIDTISRRRISLRPDRSEHATNTRN